MPVGSLSKIDVNAYGAIRLGGEFEEIAGNNSAIFLTILVDADLDLGQDVQVIFTQPLPSNPDKQRIALVTPVPLLHALLVKLDRHGVEIEHVYDF